MHVEKTRYLPISGAWIPCVLSVRHHVTPQPVFADTEPQNQMTFFPSECVFTSCDFVSLFCHYGRCSSWREPCISSSPPRLAIPQIPCKLSLQLAMMTTPSSSWTFQRVRLGSGDQNMRPAACHLWHLAESRLR